MRQKLKILASSSKRGQAKPVIIVNFKTYKKGKDALKLARAIERVDKKIIIGVQSSHISEIAKKTKLEVFAEHVDGSRWYSVPCYTAFGRCRQRE